MATNTQRPLDLLDARIARVASAYGPSTASVRATLVFGTDGAARGSDERRALATLHRLAADYLEALPEGSYSAPLVEVTGSHRNRVHAALTVELVDGTDSEAERVVELLHDVVPAPDAQ